MRRVRYSVAMSLDGFIAGPHGEIDWVLVDPDIDFGELVARFDTVLMGRGSYDDMVAQGRGGPVFGLETYVASRTLDAAEHPGVTVWRGDVATELRAALNRAGKDVWLFGGGELFRSLLDAGLVHAVEVAVIPVLLGAGIPLLASPSQGTELALVEKRVYEKTGTVWLEYAVVDTEGRPVA